MRSKISLYGASVGLVPLPRFSSERGADRFGAFLQVELVAVELEVHYFS